jgi:serine/threonine-protein kinase
MVFLVKAGILSGAFYAQALALFITAGLMAIFPDYSHFIFGIVAAACFFFPGLKYYRQRVRNG